MEQIIKLLNIAYINTCVTFTSLVFFYFLLSRDSPLGPKSAINKRIIYGLVCGAVSAFLDQDVYRISDVVYYSFEIIPIIICTFYVGWLSASCAFLINFFFTGMFTPDNIFVFSMLMGIFYFSPWKNNTIRTFNIAISIVIIIRLIVALPYLNTGGLVWGALAYQIATLFCFSICYHSLSSHFYFVKKFFNEKNKAASDFLTKTLNRMGFEEYIEVSLRNSSEFCIAILDVDYFKRVNDVYGHATGDVVLVKIADIIRENLRSDDVLGRFGGEEFVLLIDINTLEEGVECCERIRHAVERTVFTSLDNDSFNVTLSLGVAYYNPDISLQENIIVADRALYQSKNSGRNRTTSIQ
ncbi:GGDEF domain-containing protein [Erwinia amylovora]